MLTEGRITGDEVLEIVAFAKTMLSADVELLEHVSYTIRTLASKHTLMVITKGDASEQMPKLARSGLLDAFSYAEVVGSKTTEVYRRLLMKHRIAPDRFLMVGNSLKSDILRCWRSAGTVSTFPPTCCGLTSGSTPHPRATRDTSSCRTSASYPISLMP